MAYQEKSGSAKGPGRVLYVDQTCLNGDIFYEKSERARARYGTQMQLVLGPSEVNENFLAFLALVYGKPARIEASAAPALLQIASTWGCASAIKELELQLIRSQNIPRIIDFLCACPTSFPQLSTYVMGNLKEFLEDPHFATVPMDVIGHLLYGEDIPPDPSRTAQEAAQRLQDVLDPSTGEVEEVQELERQHRTLTSEVEGLKQRIAQAEEETQKHAQRLREIESQADEVKLATAEIQKCMGEAQIAIQHALIETGVSQMMQAKQNKQRQTPDTKPQRGKGNFRK